MSELSKRDDGLFGNILTFLLACTLVLAVIGWYRDVPPPASTQVVPRTYHEHQMKVLLAEIENLKKNADELNEADSEGQQQLGRCLEENARLNKMLRGE